MALPQTAIEQLSHAPSRSPGWFGQLLMFSGTLFFITVVVYFGLIFGYKPYVNSQVKNLDEQIKKFSVEIPVEDQKNTVNFYAQLVNLRTVLDNHNGVSQLFGWLEDNTLPAVYFTKMTLNIPNNQMVLAGIARTMDDATHQMQIFQQKPEVQRFSVTTIRFDAGKNTWDFEATIFFAPGFFKVRPAQAPSVDQPILPPAQDQGQSTSTPTSTPR